MKFSCHDDRSRLRLLLLRCSQKSSAYLTNSLKWKELVEMKRATNASDSDCKPTYSLAKIVGLIWRLLLTNQSCDRCSLSLWLDLIFLLGSAYIVSLLDLGEQAHSIKISRLTMSLLLLALLCSSYLIVLVHQSYICSQT